MPWALASSMCHSLLAPCCRGLLYCMEYLEDNLEEWLGAELQAYGDDDYLLFVSRASGNGMHSFTVVERLGMCPCPGGFGILQTTAASIGRAPPVPLPVLSDLYACQCPARCPGLPRPD